MTPTDYNTRAAYYECLTVSFGSTGAHDSCRFYQQVAQRCREYAGYAKEAA